MLFYVYVLESIKLGKLYTGLTTDLRRRIKEHNEKKSIATKSGCPWRIVYYEAHLNKDDAVRRERYFKTSQGKRTLRLILRNYLSNKSSKSSPTTR